MDDLFFAEVTSMIGDDKLVVSCFCRVKTTDNGIILSYPKSHFVQIKFMSRTNLNLSDRQFCKMFVALVCSKFNMARRSLYSH